MNEVIEMKELISKLNEYTKYYDLGTPKISDEEWDKFYFSLVNLEKETGIVYPNSPTQSIQYEIVNELPKKPHIGKPMLSLDKTKEINDIKNFVKGHDWLAMFKLDGLSVRLTYDDGELVGAETRGNGLVGEWIYHNALIINNIPKVIPVKRRIVIDGEVICTWNDFNSNLCNEYTHPRALVSGSVRLLSSQEAEKRKLRFIAWDLIEGEPNIDFFFWRLEKLDDWGFDTVPRIGDAETVSDAIEALNQMQNEYDYPIDGYVFRFESQKYYDSLGHTDHHFRGAYAYKFYDEEYETRLKYIKYDVSRNGILTPVAVFEPIEIDGSIVERASLHNISIMKETLGNTPYSGEKIWVIKSNMIIPQITRADKKDYGDIIAAGGVTVGLGGDYGVLCPICGCQTSIKISESGVETLYCENEECPGKLAQRIDHFCSKKGLDIKGISRKTIEKLIDWGWIDKLVDLFKLDKHKIEWISKEGFGTTSVEKILLSINLARSESSLENFLSAIGIPLVGKTVAKEIVKYYPTWKDFREAIGGDWTEFEGFGPEISKAINSFNYIEADEVAEVLDFANNKVQSQETLIAANIKDKKFCVTGKITHFKNRDELKADIEAKGGKLVNSVTSVTDYLITNTPDSGTTKNTSARKLGIPIITEEEYLQMSIDA